jgi:hypothetical protein
MTMPDTQTLGSLMHRIASGEQDVNRSDFERRLRLEPGWDWHDVEAIVEAGEMTVEDVENAIHAGLN